MEQFFLMKKREIYVFKHDFELDHFKSNIFFMQHQQLL